MLHGAMVTVFGRTMIASAKKALLAVEGTQHQPARIVHKDMVRHGVMETVLGPMMTVSEQKVVTLDNILDFTFVILIK